MKVAIVHDWMTTLGGGEKVVLTLAQALGAEIVTSELDPDVPRKAGFEGVRVRPIAALSSSMWFNESKTSVLERLLHRRSKSYASNSKNCSTVSRELNSDAKAICCPLRKSRRHSSIVVLPVPTSPVSAMNPLRLCTP